MYEHKYEFEDWFTTKWPRVDLDMLDDFLFLGSLFYPCIESNKFFTLAKFTGFFLQINDQVMKKFTETNESISFYEYFFNAMSEFIKFGKLYHSEPNFDDEKREFPKISKFSLNSMVIYWKCKSIVVWRK